MCVSVRCALCVCNKNNNEKKGLPRHNLDEEKSGKEGGEKKKRFGKRREEGGGKVIIRR